MSGYAWFRQIYYDLEVEEISRIQHVALTCTANRRSSTTDDSNCRQLHHRRREKGDNYLLQDSSPGRASRGVATITTSRFSCAVDTRIDVALATTQVVCSNTKTMPQIKTQVENVDRFYRVLRLLRCVYLLTHALIRDAILVY